MPEGPGDPGGDRRAHDSVRGSLNLLFLLTALTGLLADCLCLDCKLMAIWLACWYAFQIVQLRVCSGTLEAWDLSG
jgi:hypothetical protein